ncbi:MAG: peptide-methionine (S)-S-oxide reductase MsrA [Gammaproteobacteria bacterium]|nr:peptide-methionine (S)-S-oxide reductase MsrA [Gammaproteobacteria bacterium]
MGLEHKLRLPTEDEAVPGSDAAVRVPPTHFVNGNPISPPFPDGMQQIVVAMGCFWGAERKFWETPGVYATAVGYAGGITVNPSYEQVCSGLTGHTEVVLVVFDPDAVSLANLFKVFWEGHDPTQGMRQGNDLGTQYRSAIYVYDARQRVSAQASRDAFQRALDVAGFGRITTEIDDAPTFYYAEHDHQQYLAKVPNGYCGLGSTGVTCNIEPLATLADEAS